MPCMCDYLGSSLSFSWYIPGIFGSVELKLLNILSGPRVQDI